ncbi:glycosyltransferase AglE [Geobacter sp. OR-1]|uniref:glycosyltransferase n=1 Tax=Geobacter sp. OR-1 TaxID=1266765 RepID=UPI000543F9E4|nr:glycosyltransferase [Geobacter sp. OR-1]GAM10595.1 glycosyltransferase AglE [Geobacter sp. OR-1]
MQFSIIIPAKNEEANIGRCLDSINRVEFDKNQFEVIVVDNGSSDGTVEIAETKGATVYIKPDLTISGLRNFGAGQASGEILSFIDADCTVIPSWLRNASAYLMKNEVACFGSPPIVPDNANWVPKVWFAVRRKDADLCETDWLESMNMFVRREAFAASGGFDESLITCEDYDLSMRLKPFGAIISDSSIVAVHHGEAATVSHFFRKELWRGKSNFTGMLQHGLTLSEIPSLIAPSFHCLIWICWLFSLLSGHNSLILDFSAGLIIWQVLLLLKSFRKLPPHNSITGLLQLHFLLNIYLFARGAGVFSSGRRTGVSQCAG